MKEIQIPFNSEMVRAILEGRKQGFLNIWRSIYPSSWERNDWAWCCEFERQ